MLYAANADGKITPEEGALIIPTLSREDYDKVKAIFYKCDDAKALEIIMSYRDKYCSTQAEKDKILADMLAIYNADDNFEQIERGVHQLFKRML